MLKYSNLATTSYKKSSKKLKANAWKRLKRPFPDFPIGIWNFPNREIFLRDPINRESGNPKFHLQEFNWFHLLNNKKYFVPSTAIASKRFVSSPLWETSKNCSPVMIRQIIALTSHWICRQTAKHYNPPSVVNLYCHHFRSNKITETSFKILFLFSVRFYSCKVQRKETKKS